VSGCAAALAAARNGASVLVLEQNGYLGGTLTACGVGPMMTFHAGEKQVIRGVMQELVEELVRRGWSVGHVPDTKQYTSTITPFDAEGLKLVLDEKLGEAGCSVLFHTFVGAVAVRDGAVEGLTVCNKDGLSTVSAKVYIDASGDGDVAAWAGAEMTKGRPEDGAAQPMTMKMKYCGVDTGALKGHVLAHPERFGRLEPHFDLFRRDIPIDLEGFDEEFSQAKAEGELSIRRENVLLFGTGRPGEYILNTTPSWNTTPQTPRASATRSGSAAASAPSWTVSCGARCPVLNTRCWSSQARRWVCAAPASWWAATR
jgi:hypothetical protein